MMANEIVNLLPLQCTNYSLLVTCWQEKPLPLRLLAPGREQGKGRGEIIGEHLDEYLLVEAVQLLLIWNSGVRIGASRGEEEGLGQLEENPLSFLNRGKGPSSGRENGI